MQSPFHILTGNFGYTEVRPSNRFLSHYAIHVPIDKDVRFYDKYKKKGLSDKEAAYASLIEGMDKSLGDIMDWLEKNGEADNTIVIFMSDNGGYATCRGKTADCIF